MSKIPCGGFELGDSLVVNDGKLDLAPGAGGGLPTGEAPYQQLVTDGDGNAKWEDRLAYVATEEKVIFSQENIQFEDWGALYGYEIESPFGEIVIGQKYTVVWDGVTYPDLVAFDDGDPTIGSPNGNITDELPFCIYTYGEEHYVSFETTSVEATHSVTILGPVETIHKIPQQYLPKKKKFYVDTSNPDKIYLDSERKNVVTAEDFISAVNSAGIDFIALNISQSEVHLPVLDYAIINETGIVLVNVAMTNNDGSIKSLTYTAASSNSYS